MASPLLATKLYAPRPRSGLVPRPGLIERLRRGTESKLTLISAPAGFGKSTLLAEWMASSGRWLGLPPGSRSMPATTTRSLLDPVIAALQTVEPGIGASALSLLEAPDRPIETVLAPLLNDLDAQPGEIVLVLDDYHAIELTGHPGRDDIPAGAPAGPRPPGDRHAAPIRRCPWPACAREGS